MVLASTCIYFSLFIITDMDIVMAFSSSSYSHHQHQQQQYLESSLLLASQPLLRPQSLHHQLASLVQPGSNLTSLVQSGSTNLSSLVHPSLPLNYLNFSLLNSLGPLQAQGIKVNGAILTSGDIFQKKL